MIENQPAELRDPLMSAFRAKFRQATKLIVAVRRGLGEEGEGLHDDVVADLKDALTGDEPSLQRIEIAGESEPLL